MRQYAAAAGRGCSYLSCVPEPVFDSTATEWHAAQGWVLYAAVPLLNMLRKTFWLASCCIPMPLIECGLKVMPTLNVALRCHQTCGLEICMCCRWAFVRLSATLLQGGGKLVNNRAMHSRNTVGLAAAAAAIRLA